MKKMDNPHFFPLNIVVGFAEIFEENGVPKS
jgi:hypothetical protein